MDQTNMASHARNRYRPRALRPRALPLAFPRSPGAYLPVLGYCKHFARHVFDNFNPYCPAAAACHSTFLSESRLGGIWVETAHNGSTPTGLLNDIAFRQFHL